MKVKALIENIIVMAIICLLSMFAAGDYTNAQSGRDSTPQRFSLATSQQKEIHFHHLTTDDGLSHNSVFQVLQDRLGFIWATTGNGINKYDGLSFTPFRPHVSGHHYSTSHVYKAILEDRDGMLWFGSNGVGLVRHDPEHDTWKFYQHNENDPNSLAHNVIWSVFQDRKNILWISTFGGLSRFDPTTEQFTNFRYDPNNRDSPGYDILSDIKQDAIGILWIGTYGRGLDRFNPSTGIFTHYRHDPVNSESLSDDHVSSIWIDPDGSIWIGTNNGLNHFNPVDGRFVRYFHNKNDVSSLSHNAVVHVMRDSRNRLWISTSGGGMNRFDEQRRRFIRYQSDPYQLGGLSSDIVLNVSEDRTGSLWFATSGGINIYNPTNRYFTLYKHLPGNPSSLPQGHVRAITQDQEGTLWVGIRNQGLVRFDRKKNLYTRYQAEPGNSNSLSSNTIFDLCFDSRGWLWVATIAGLNKFNSKTDTWTQYHGNLRNPSAMAADRVSSMAVDAYGNLWLAVFGMGLHRFNPASEIFTRYQANPNNPNSIATNNVDSVMVATDGMIWLSGEGWVSCFDPATEKAVNYQPGQRGFTGYKSNQIYQDRQGRVWVAFDNGTFKFNPGSYYATPYPDIRRVIADDLQGNLWVIAAGQRLARFNPDTDTLQRYEEFNSLLHSALEPITAHMSPSGEIFISGANGFASFFPSQLANDPTPPVVLTGIELCRNPVIGGADSPLQKHISFAKSISLPYDNTALTINFAALNYRSPQKHQYAHMMEGIDKDWVYSGNRHRFATYTNLSPGQYKFRVKASNNYGVWNDEGRSLSILINQLWWKTWWFRSVVGLVLVSLFIIGFGFRVRVQHGRTTMLERQVSERVQERMESNRQLQVAKEKAEQANQAKSIYLMNMSHELRSPLNAVLGFAQMMKNAPDVTLTQLESLNAITHSGEHLLDLINNVLDMTKIESGRIELKESQIDLLHLLQETTSLMVFRADEKGLQFNLEQPPGLSGHIVVDVGKLRQVLINLIGNAIKYTTSGSVTLRAKTMKEESANRVRLRFEVEDTGPGIREEDKEKIFFPFSYPEASTPRGISAGVGLAIAKRYVELMGGSIGVSSDLEKGSLFYFEIPVRVIVPDVGSAESQRGQVIGLLEGQPVWRLLIAEDQKYSGLLLHRLLKPLGFDLQKADNGQEAVTLSTQWHPHLIFMDIHMPIMDGLAATRRIKASDAGRQTKIIALSAHALEEDRSEIMAAGCDDFIRKPYSDTEIFDMLAKHLGTRFAYKTSVPSTKGDTRPLTATELAKLPGEMLKGLEHALVRLDISAVHRAIDTIRIHYPSLADTLSREAQNLRFGQLRKLIKIIRKGTGRDKS